MSTNPSMTPNSTELETAEISLRALLQRVMKAPLDESIAQASGALREELAELRELFRNTSQDQAALLEDGLHQLQNRLKQLESASRQNGEQLDAVQAGLETAREVATAEAKVSAERAGHAEASAAAITQRLVDLSDALKQASSALHLHADGLHEMAELSIREHGVGLLRQGADHHAAQLRTTQEYGTALQQQATQLQALAQKMVRLAWFIAAMGIAGWATALVLLLRSS